VLSGYAAHDHRANGRSSKEGLYQNSRARRQERLLRVRCHLPPPLLSGPLSRKGYKCHHFSFRKEVIQPQVLLRLPCYDFTPIMNYTLDGCPLAVGSPASSATHFRDVTGGVYKARERIHRGILIRDY
jgi:hypothetical protein